MHRILEQITPHFDKRRFCRVVASIPLCLIAQIRKRRSTTDSEQLKVRQITIISLRSNIDSGRPPSWPFRAMFSPPPVTVNRPVASKITTPTTTRMDGGRGWWQRRPRKVSSGLESFVCPSRHSITQREPFLHTGIGHITTRANTTNLQNKHTQAQLGGPTCKCRHTQTQN